MTKWLAGGLAGYRQTANPEYAHCGHGLELYPGTMST